MGAQVGSEPPFPFVQTIQELQYLTAPSTCRLGILRIEFEHAHAASASGDWWGERMPVYQFKLVGRDGTTEADIRLRVADEDEAAERATELLAGSKSATVEVWQGLHLVFEAGQAPDCPPGS